MNYQYCLIMNIHSKFNKLSREDADKDKYQKERISGGRRAFEK